MPRYFFDIANGHRLIDPGGLDCASDQDAIEKAKFIARQIADETPLGARQIAIRNEDGRDVSKVPVHEKGPPQTTERNSVAPLRPMNISRAWP